MGVKPIPPPPPHTPRPQDQNVHVTRRLKAIPWDACASECSIGMNCEVKLVPISCDAHPLGAAVIKFPSQTS